ncbi:ubiquinol-cytochrome c reductase iron-sulfur subunit [Thecamonas trahens ATCC 50062]|uniref:Cytochrome b-c1 complex subunit Rieske, mitochondrial n=1 Tax=Thecamonas trahens ATCC 50062 TaxID=461836 RepID=A0A0L0DIL4_THETB|nr:ubiquinol-cytochrome c reductase iron-sulfur subunit [Thecamonas trahens ATCC 50062]KNC52224.1 ubiquinol-cytochrome c reductase iron-sulfur subunit [Thecamonas trahens ATCC 50062]|eukprot:XP_013762226.1 ubiquinol-cytochrome c reductase iron-sulfur subunit [Thecamonas trahens ATCC 50062]
MLRLLVPSALKSARVVVPKAAPALLMGTPASSSSNDESNAKSAAAAPALRAAAPALDAFSSPSALVRHASGMPTTGPDFGKYKAKGETPESSRAYAYMMVGATGFVAATMAKTMVVDFVSTMSASADVLALSSVEVDVASIPEGKSVVVKWRGKPVFIKHRTKADIDREGALDTSTLRDPETDAIRHAPGRPEWLVLLAICTHLGCVPIAGQGDYNGYFCPCHGSHYDGSGRIRKGPAPRNLEIPEYTFVSDSVVKIG